MFKQTPFFATTLLIGSVGITAAIFTLPQRSSASSVDVQIAQAPSILGSWRLVNMTESPSPMPMLPSSNTELTADFVGDRVSGSGGCNRFMGGFQTQADQLSIGPLASTFMACEEPIMTQETRYLTALQGAQRYEVDQGQLTIFYQTEKASGVLRFTAQAADNQTNPEQTSPEPTNPSPEPTPTQPSVKGLW